MARAKASRLSVKATRLAFPITKRPVFESLGDGISIGYRRNNGAGVWVARRSDGKGGKFERRLGLADDYADADGEGVLTFAQASAKAHDFDPFTAKATSPVESEPTVDAEKPITLRQTLDSYEQDLKTRGGDVANAERVRAHLSEDLMNKAVTNLTVTDLKTWRDDLSKTLVPSSINRTTTPLKAALNLAADVDQGNTIKTRAPWEIGLATLNDAVVSRNVVLPESEIAKIVSASYAESIQFGLLVEVAAVTGSRYSQMAKLTVGDLHDGAEPRLIEQASKKGKKKKKILLRAVPITAALAKKLRKAAEGRPADARLLVKPSGEAWAKSDHSRPFARAVQKANLDAMKIAPFAIDEVTIYALRHSSIVRQILRGVPLRVIAALHDTSVAMIEKTYSSRITDHADGLARAAMEDFSIPVAPSAEATATGPSSGPAPGFCRHGHSYAEHPPYKNKKGAIVCSACAKERTRRNKATKRAAHTSNVTAHPREPSNAATRHDDR